MGARLMRLSTTYSSWGIELCAADGNKDVTRLLEPDRLTIEIDIEIVNVALRRRSP